MHNYMSVMQQVAPIANAVVGLGFLCAMLVWCWNNIKLVLVTPWKQGMKLETSLVIAISIMSAVVMFAFISVTTYWTLVAFGSIVAGYWFALLLPLWKQEGISKIQVALVICGNPFAWIPMIMFVWLRKRSEKKATTEQAVPA